jgi:hypothetical protein
LNGRFIDVIHGRCCSDEFSLIAKNGRIVAMMGIPREPDIPADLEIDLRGKTVIAWGLIASAVISCVRT